MRRSKPAAVALAFTLALGTTLVVHAWSSPLVAQPAMGGPGWTIEVDLSPRPGPARGQYQMVAAVRDAAGGRLQTVTLEVAPGQDARSQRAVPGGGTFSVEVAMVGGHRGATWSAEVRRDGQLVLGQRAQVRLED